MLAYPTSLSMRRRLLCASVSCMSFFRWFLSLDGPFFHASEISLRCRSMSSSEMVCWLALGRGSKGTQPSLRRLGSGVVVSQDDDPDDEPSPKLFVFWRCRLWRIRWLSDWLKAFCTHVYKHNTCHITHITWVLQCNLLGQLLSSLIYIKSSPFEISVIKCPVSQNDP